MSLYVGNIWDFQEESDCEDNGIDWDGQVAEEEPNNIDVPMIQCPVNDGDFQLLQGVVNPDNDSDHYGRALHSVQGVCAISMQCPRQNVCRLGQQVSAY